MSLPPDYEQSEKHPSTDQPVGSAADMIALLEYRRRFDSAILKMELGMENESVKDSESSSSVLETEENVIKAASSFKDETKRLIFFGMVFSLLAFFVYLLGEGKLPLPTIGW